MNYLLLCKCGNKVFTDGNNLNLYEVKTAPIPKRWDGKDKDAMEQKKKFKCPQCGYIFEIIKMKSDKPEEDDGASHIL